MIKVRQILKLKEIVRVDKCHLFINFVNKDKYL